jgi:hypothetical protein
LAQYLTEQKEEGTIVLMEGNTTLQIGRFKGRPVLSIG